METIGTATYSPEDNKLRLYPLHRLDPDLYQRVKAAGFKWAPRQELFVAPAWGPRREDLLLELCGEIGDEDKSLVDRAEERSERFEEYSEKRAGDAESARKAVAAIADNIPLGQPILVGHHSERHARKDAERIRSGMSRAVQMWRTSQYWQARAAGAVRAAKYKERPDVRARRIKTIEADRRRVVKNRDDTETQLKLWRRVLEINDPDKQRATALHIANFGGHMSFRFPLADYPRDPPASQYEGDMSLWSALDGGVITAVQAANLAIPQHESYLPYAARWIEHYDNRLAYERAMLGEQGGTVADQVKPEKGGACRCWASPRGGWSYIKKVNKVSVTVEDNWGNGGPNFTRTMPFDKLHAIMSAADVQKARDEGRMVESGQRHPGFYLTDAAPPAIAPEKPEPEPADIRAIEAALKQPINVIAVPQLFETPRPLAQRMVELADIGPDDRVLEPSAGKGAILSEIGDTPEKVAVELNVELAAYLERLPIDNLAILQGDFLECSPEQLGTFDRIVMNPPFADGADIKHIEHALAFLKPGGRLVALCANGPRQQKKLKELTQSWGELPADTFRDQGTGVRAVLLTIKRMEA